MSRLIDADALTERLNEYANDDWNVSLGGVFTDAVDTCLDFVENAPTIEAMPVVWKPIDGFEGLYEISNFGQVRNNKGEILKHGIKRTNCTCYKNVRLWKDGKYHNKYIHRLIAEAFIPNPTNLPFINHKDEDGTNNLIENLEWCTREYNVNYGTARARQAKKVRGKESEKRKVVVQSDLDGNVVAQYPSITLAANEICGSTSAISQVCNKKRKTYKGFLWEYAFPSDMRKGGAG